MPEHIGPYRILGELGRGGMGVVYLAEQIKPVRRRVALKMLHGGLASREQQVRFEAERQAMARLQHPNIAQLFEAASTPDGQSYFVMEWVEGLPITEYCDRKKLGIRERLELFRSVCGGVQHAHEKGLLHRDIKPANILVAETKDRPVPKILDFGIAKAIDQPLVEGTLYTGERIIGTPAYLSPEATEAVGSGFDLDTRSDVYSLGVLLYELLVGVRPIETEGVPFVQVLRRITEDDPLEPSARWTRMGEEARTRLAEVRRVHESSLPRRLRGDLDCIVLTAIAKDRQDRYGSAAALASDIGRHLRNEPVEARPPSTLYRVGKFVRRNRGFVVGAALVFASLVLGLTGTLLNLERARRGEARAHEEAVAAREALAEAREVSEFLQGLFEVSDPDEARGNSITAREILDQGAERIRTGFEGRPLVKARFMSTIGTVYEKLGLYDLAHPLLEDALEIREAELDPGHVEVAASLESLGILYRERGRLDDAEQMLRRSLEIRESALGPDHPDTARSLSDLAKVYGNQGRLAEAEPLFRRSLEIEERLHGPVHANVATTLHDLAVCAQLRGRYAEAESLHQRSLEIFEKVLPADHPDLALSYSNLGFLYWSQGKLDEAEPFLERALAIRTKSLPEGHRLLGASYANLGLVQWKWGRLEEARPNLERAIETYQENLEPDHPWIGEGLWGLAGVYRDQGRYEDAEPLYRRALEILEATSPPGDPLLSDTLTDYAMLLRATGRESEARELESRAGGDETR